MLRELTWRTLSPALITGTEVQELRAGQRISYALSPLRFCVGYKRFGSSVFAPCPSKSTIPSGKESQCDFCAQQDVSFAAKSGYGISKQAGELLASDHAVYLAYFSDTTIKVGVAMWDRREIRVSEQGAVACLFIAKGNGTLARNLERQIHTSAGFTEWVRLETKIKAVFKCHPTEEKAKQSLMNALKKVKETAPSTALLNEPIFIYTFPRYMISDVVFEKDIATALKLEGGAKIDGYTRGIYGKVLLIEAGEIIYAINSQLLAGYDFLPVNNDTRSAFDGVEVKKISIDRQQTLLDFF